MYVFLCVSVVDDTFDSSKGLVRPQPISASSKQPLYSDWAQKQTKKKFRSK